MERVESYLLGIEQLGIKKGDILLVSSDVIQLSLNYKKEFGERLNLDMVINYLQSLIGQEGTLLFPTYNWEFCHGMTFDYFSTKCQTGALGITALKREDFRRTQHPIYSFAVWGKDQSLLCDMTNKSSFGEDSPFAYFVQNKAKNLFIDIGLHGSFTLVHYAEQLAKVPYRYEKEFTASYINEEREEDIRTYSMYVRDLDLDVEGDSSPLETIMLNDNKIKKVYLHDIPFMILNMHEALEYILHDIGFNKCKSICKYKGQ